jgi:hypothetical protein
MRHGLARHQTFLKREALRLAQRTFYDLFVLNYGISGYTRRRDRVQFLSGIPSYRPAPLAAGDRPFEHGKGVQGK